MYYFDLSTLFRERCYEIYTAFQRPPLCIAWLASLALASPGKRVLHRDVKGDNVLVTWCTATVAAEPCSNHDDTIIHNWIESLILNNYFFCYKWKVAITSKVCFFVDYERLNMKLRVFIYIYTHLIFLHVAIYSG